MDSFEVKGTIYKVGGVNEFGGGFRKREVIVKTEGEYPQHILLEFIKDKADNFNGQVGNGISATCQLEGRLWNGDNGEKCFVSVKCWKWELNGVAAQITQPTPEPVVMPEGDDQSDLPF